MLGSLRFRLPALFLLGIVLAGLVTALISIRFFQSYTRARAVDELRSESVGIVSLYSRQAGLETVPYRNLIRALGGDRIYWAPAFKGAELYQSIPELPSSILDRKAVRAIKGTTTMEMPVKGRRYLTVARPLYLGDQLLGALVVAKPTSQLRSRSLTLAERLLLAFAGGVIVSGLLGVYLSRRITRPLLSLSHAADEVAGGNYGVELPDARGSDEISHLSGRFGEMTSRLAESELLSRNFLMTVSHELRTPITAIRGHASALREGVIDDPDMREQSLAVIEEEALRLERLVGDVLDLAKLDAHRFTVLTEEVDMGRVLERAYSTFSEEARQRGIEYTSEAESAPVIVSDGDRVLQIISNLLSNAFRWTPDGGRIDLALQTANGTVTVDVADSGPGITADARERIFRPFWSTDGRGTGLGLPIARELAVALGGRIELQTEVGKGSRFRLVLPNRSF